jgi:class 3 adenylate cyclase
MADHPRGTVAFLFTDVEGSSRLWQAHQTAMPAAYSRHDAILRGGVGPLLVVAG